MSGPGLYAEQSPATNVLVVAWCWAASDGVRWALGK